MSSKLCRLCFEERAKPIGIFGADGIELNIADTIRVHLADEVNENDFLPKSICQNCWNTLQQFHNFYNTVNETRHSYLLNFVKHEEPNFEEINCDSISCDDESMITALKHEPTPDIVDSSFQLPLLGDCVVEGDSVDHVDIFKLEDSIPTEHPDKNNPLNIENDIDFLLSDYLDMFCDICDQPFNTLNEAYNHYKNIHQRTTIPLKCCQRRIHIYGELKEHVQYHLNPSKFKCDECGKVCISKVQLNVHKRCHLKAQCQCDICKKEMSYNSLRAHFAAAHSKDEGEQKCRNCGDIFANKFYLGKHLKRVHSNRYHRIPGDFKCGECDQTYGSRHLLNKHLLIHSGLECDVCSKKFLSKTGLKFHLIKKHTSNAPQYKCEICGNRYNLKHKLSDHVRSVHGVLQEEEHRCHICTITYTTRRELLVHFKEHSDAQELVFHCSHCGKSFTRESYLRAHVKNAHEIDGEVYKCPHCPKELTKRTLLNNHIARYHKSQMCKCEICGKEYKGTQELKVHMTVHTGVRAFKCKYCPKTFKFHANVYRHQKKMHPSCALTATVTECVNQHSSEFKCDICSKGFNSKRSFETHMINWHTPNTPRYECDICKKRLLSMITLNAHMKTLHDKRNCDETDICKSGESDVTEPKAVCEHCGKSFKNKCRMLAHVKNMHEEDGKMHECPHCHRQFARKTLLYNHISRHHSSKTRQCNFCDKVYKCADALKEHMTKHTGEDAYKCKYCDETFRNRFKMYIHLKRDHWDEWNADRIARSGGK